MENIVKTSLTQNIARLLLGTFLVGAGIGHLTWARQEFQAQVPPWVPMNTDLVVILSGIVEILLGGSLLMLKRYRIKVGWVAAIFFLLVFPGNIAQFANHRDGFGLNSDTSRFIRLLFQPVLIVWALWSTGVWPRVKKII
ncbi:MAG: hypothetical protein ABIS36_04620 [Chryseolinea sp.]